MPQLLGGDRFVAGGEVRVERPVDGDLVVTGGDVDLDAVVAGDVLAFGGKLRLSGDVGGSMTLALLGLVPGRGALPGFVVLLAGVDALALQVRRPPAAA